LADHAENDPGAALWPVQFAARQLLALAGIPFSIAGGVIALFVTGLDFSMLRRDRFRVSVRRLGDERHPDHHLFNQTRSAGMGTVEAMYQAAEQRMRPMFDDGLVGLHRPLASRNFNRHRQPGPAAGWRPSVVAAC